MASVSLPIPALSVPQHRRHSQEQNNSPPNQINPPSSSTPAPKPTIRARLSKLCISGQPHLARQLFDTIPQPTTVLWNTIIIGFVCNNLSDQALLFYARMKSSSIDTQFDSYTYSSTLKACANSGNLRIGKAVHCHVLRCQLNPSRIVYNSLLNMYASCVISMIDRDIGSSESDDFSKYDIVCKVFDTMRNRNIVAWNTMISWYVKTNRFVEAFKLFKTVMEMGMKPTTISFVNLFPAMPKLGDYDNADVLYGIVLKLGSDFVNDFFVVSSAIFMYSELGFIDIARSIFNGCLEKNTEIWNTMIGGYVQNNCFIDGIYLFVQALDSEKVVLDEVTFLHVLNAASQLQQLDISKQLHAYIIKSAMGFHSNITNAIIVMYSRCGEIETSFKVFDNMLERDVVSWNTMVSSLVQKGMDDEGLMLVHAMQQEGFKIDHVTVTALLSLASNLRNQEIGKQTHGYLLRHQIRFEGMESYLIDMYAKSELINTAQRLFTKIDSNYIDHATWNAMIGGYTQNGLFEEGLLLFRQMLEKNMTPNATTIASILPTCSPMGVISIGKQFHGFSIRQLINDNVFVGSALIDMYSKSGAINYAESIFFNAPEKNSVTYTNMILAYGQHGMGEKSLALFYSMNKSCIKPDAITFVAVLSACSYAGLVDKGLQIFDAMKREYKIEPSAEHYSCIVDMLGRVGRVMEGYEFVKDLGDKCNLLGIWGSLLGACRIHGETELGKVVAKKMVDLEGHDDVAGYRVLLSNMYASDEKWDEVDKVRKGMNEKGLRKEIGCSWIDIAGNVDSFVSKDQNHSDGNMIYEMLDLLTVDMKLAGYRPFGLV